MRERTFLWWPVGKETRKSKLKNRARIILYYHHAKIFTKNKTFLIFLSTFLAENTSGYDDGVTTVSRVNNTNIKIQRYQRKIFIYTHIYVHIHLSYIYNDIKHARNQSKNPPGFRVADYRAGNNHHHPKRRLWTCETLAIRR